MLEGSLEDVCEGRPETEEAETRTNQIESKNGNLKDSAGWMLQHTKFWNFEVHSRDWSDEKRRGTNNKRGRFSSCWGGGSSGSFLCEKGKGILSGRTWFNRARHGPGPPRRRAPPPCDRLCFLKKRIIDVREESRVRERDFMNFHLEERIKKDFTSSTGSALSFASLGSSSASLRLLLREWLNWDQGKLSIMDFLQLQPLSILTSWSAGFLEDSPCTFSLNLIISSISLNLATLALNSSNVAGDCLHRLF
ncbi:hypothetical protein HKD37_14G040064 [Glycine soja]